jgi:hypothetical protein
MLIITTGEPSPSAALHQLSIKSYFYPPHRLQLKITAEPLSTMLKPSEAISAQAIAATFAAKADSLTPELAAEIRKLGKTLKRDPASAIDRGIQLIGSNPDLQSFYEAKRGEIQDIVNRGSKSPSLGVAPATKDQEILKALLETCLSLELEPESPPNWLKKLLGIESRNIKIRSNSNGLNFVDKHKSIDQIIADRQESVQANSLLQMVIDDRLTQIQLSPSQHWHSLEQFRTADANEIYKITPGTVGILQTDQESYRILNEKDFQKLLGLAGEVDRLQQDLTVITKAIRAVHNHPQDNDANVLLMEAVAMLEQMSAALPTRSNFPPLELEDLAIDQDDEVILDPAQIQRPLN